ncbi:hypothetical protein HQQ81_12995 [Microbacteriaceae bacterium VKM Ac-2854]|nr:hypothetical protein [Microbacteriaceae bacterium VKM Ac-2854]
MNRVVGWSVVAVVAVAVVAGATWAVGFDKAEARAQAASFLAEPALLETAGVISGSAIGTSFWQQSQTVLAVASPAAARLRGSDPVFADCGGSYSCADGWGVPEAIDTGASLPLTAVPVLESQGEDPGDWSCTGRTLAENGKSPWAEAVILCLDEPGERLLLARSRT